ncbi:MAG: hypothetical protein U0326_17200 [Polyangiales bacterium]
MRKNGPFESETLLSLVQAERALRRERTVGDCEYVDRLLGAAERKDRVGNGERIALQRIQVLAAWLRLEPGAPAATKALAGIAERWARLRQEVEFAKVGGDPRPEGLVEAIVRHMQHPSFRAFIDTMLLVDEIPSAQRTLSKQVADGLGRVTAEELDAFSRSRSIASDPDKLAEKALELAQPSGDEEKPGRLTARARVLARLAVYGRAARGEVSAAARDAEAAVAGIEDRDVRASLLMGLAGVWGPLDFAHPLIDFAEAARLSELAVEAAPDGGLTELDALLHLARATQHRTDGDLRAHHERAETIYKDIIARAPALGADTTLSSAQQNLAALTSLRGTGAYDDRSVEARTLQSQAASLGNVMGLANQAWELTMLAMRRRGSERDEFLRQALQMFQRVPMETLTESERINVEHNRTIAETMLLASEGRRSEAANQWRVRLELAEVKRRPDLLARTRHNLGDHLMEHPATLAEGLRVLAAALEGRPIERVPREHWETCLSIARGLLPMLAGGLPWTAPMSRQAAFARTVSAVRSAITAGRRLGLGEELHFAGRSLCELALVAERDAEFEALVEEGWRALSDALPCMLGRDEAAFIEAELAEAAAHRVLRARLATSVVGLLREEAEVLHGDAAEAVRAWVERASLPQQRRLAARFARPPWCDDATWREWNSLLDAQAPLAIAREVERLRAEHPDFLDLDGDSAVTAAWLSATPRRGIVTLTPSADGVLATVTTSDRTYATLLSMPSSPVSPEQLPELIASLPDSSEAAKQFERVTELARASLVEPLMSLVGAPLEHVRLVTGARLRWLAPSALFPGAPVHVSPAVRLSRRAAITNPVARRVAFIAADPHGDLRDGVAAVGSFSLDLSPDAEVVTALGTRARWGRALEVPAAGLVDRSPSPDTLAEIAVGADVIVLLAHGRVIDEIGPCIELMSDDGSLARLDARAIAARATAFAGRHVVLLSCEAGFVDATPNRLGLLLGELLACGAASVTAPSWAVPMRAALSVCCFVVQALLRGREPEEGTAEAIRQQLAGEGDAGTLLGGRVTPADRRAKNVAAARAWVTWRP